MRHGVPKAVDTYTAGQDIPHFMKRDGSSLFLQMSTLGYGLDNRGSRVRFPAGAGNFSLHHRVQNGSGTHPASYPKGTRGPFPGSKAAEARN
jgi:hypothetical protein